MKLRQAFTLTELMVVIGILMVLTALVFPVLAKAKESARQTQSLAQLRQLHVALTLYRNDHETTSVSESLPPHRYVYETSLGLGKNIFASPCGYRAIVPNTSQIGIVYSFTFGKEAIFDELGEIALIFYDPSCNPSREVWESGPALKRGLGVRLNGELLNRFRRGRVGSREFWD
jgi:type II secretory pathway pseudopilin PulG